MSVNWSALGHCHRCLYPEGTHHESCEDHPLSRVNRIRVANIIDYDLTVVDSEVEAVVEFARAVIEARLYRLTVPCPDCSHPERVLCDTCSHPRGTHDGDDTLGACKMFPVCPCDRFTERECQRGCREGRVVPEEVLEALSRQLGGVEYPEVRDALFLAEAVIQREIGLE